MSKIYEDEFMEIQSGIISLCLELVENRADKVYAYCSMEEKSTSFNAFFEAKGEIKMLHELGIETDTLWEFLSLGMSDLKKLREICSKYKQRNPTEMKLIYDQRTGQLDAKYRYEPICSAETGVDSSEIFMDWVNEKKQ